MSVNDGTENNEIYLLRGPGNALEGQGVVSGASQTRAIFQGGYTGSRRIRSGTYRGAYDGALAAEQTVSIPSGMNRIDIGKRIGGSMPINGQIRRVLILPDMSDAQLQALTI